MGSFRFKVLALAALLVLATQLGTVGAVLFSSNRGITTRGDEMLVKAVQLTEQMSVARTARLRSAGQVLASDSHLRSTIEAKDLGTTSLLLKGFVGQAEVDMGMVLDPTGRALASTVAIEPERLRLPGLISHAQTSGAVRYPLQTYGQYYEVVTVPIAAPEPVAWLVLGFQIDDKLASRLSAITGLGVTVLARTGEQPQLIGSSLPAPEAASITMDAIARNLDSASPAKIGNADGGHLVLLTPLIPGFGAVELLLSEPMDALMAPFHSTRASVLAISGIALLLALGGAAFVSRTITRPIQQLADAARRIRDGDYGQPVSVPGDGEVADLSRALHAMQESIAEREQHITYQARFDAITGLPNRLQGLERLEEAVRSANSLRQPVTALVVDLNEFSSVGTSLGSDIGDALLCQAAERLRSTLDPRHFLARLEGDQFLVVLVNTPVEAGVELAEDLVRLLGSGLSVRDVNVGVDARCGLAAFPQHGTLPEQVFQRAAVARNEARSHGNSVRVYEDGNEERHHRQLTLLSDLRRAARHDEFRIYMQPKIRLKDGRICGAEALVRWQHPRLGFLPPDQFIPIAEQSGNIGIITRWALTASVRECRLWLEEGLRLPVSVNLSSRDLQDQDLPLYVRSLLRDHDLDPALLMLEITEEAVMGDFERATVVLQCLRDLGIRIAMDDFGTGQSSLAKIRHLPVDELKVDRSFVRNVPEDRQNAAIVRTIVELGHNLGMEVLAEGVETRPALSWLQAIGCERAQGYLVSKPMPAEHFAYWVGEHERDDARPTAILRAVS